MKQLTLLLSMTIILFTTILACNKDDKKDNNSGTTRLEVRLTDASGPYEEVNVDIQSISINSTDNESSGWQELSILVPGIYNLLDFQNGIDTLLAAHDIPSGRINQIRLNLGERNTIKKNGITHELETPSGTESGLKLNIHADLIPDITYRLWIDFNAARSVVETGSDKYLLKPVIRAYTEAVGGTLEGTILPAEAKAFVWAILDTDSLVTYPSDNGFFRLSGLKESSSWKVIYDADNTTGYRDTILNNISVTRGRITTLSTINLNSDSK